MTHSRIVTHVLRNLILLALLCPSALLAQDTPLLPAPPGTVAPISDSTPSGWRNPYCPNILKRLKFQLLKATDDSTASKLENLPKLRSGSAELYFSKMRNATLERVKVHFYGTQPIEIMDSGISLKASYLALDKSSLIPPEKAIANAAEQYAAEIEATLKSAETYPARWKELIEVEAQSKLRLEILEKEISSIQERAELKKDWIRSLDAKIKSLKTPVELELPTFNLQGDLNKETARVTFTTRASAIQTITESKNTLKKSLEFEGPYWVELPAVRNGEIAPVPLAYSYEKLTDLQVAVKKLRRQIETLDGDYKTEGSFLNAAAGQVVNLKQMQVIREIFRIQRQNLQSNAKDVPQYFNDQIKRVDAIIDAMNKSKPEFTPPQVAFEKVRSKQLANQLAIIPKNIRADINKPIKLRSQWDDTGTGTLDVTSNGKADVIPGKVDDLPITNPADPGVEQKIGTGPGPGTGGGPSAGAGNSGLGSAPSGTGPTWGDLGTAGSTSTGVAAGSFIKYISRKSPLADRYDLLLSKINEIDPTLLEAYSKNLAKSGMALALFRGGKFITYASGLTGAAYLGTPKAWMDAFMTFIDKSDEKQMDLCASQGAKQVGDLSIPSDPNTNATSDQAFQDCSIAFIKTKFVKDYLSELAKNDDSVTTDKQNDLARIDIKKVPTRPTKGNFFRNKKTGELYIRPEVATLAVVQQPGVSMDPTLKAMKVDPNRIPIAGSQPTQHLIEKDPKTGNLLFHVDLLASSESGIFFLNNKHEIVLSSKINEYVEKLLRKRRKVMGYRNNQSNVESVLRQFLSTANPCSDPNYTRWMTSNSKAEYKEGFLACVRFLYPRFMKLGDTESLVTKLIAADTKEQNDLLKPLLTIDATFGNYVCTLISQRYLYTDANAATNAFAIAPFNCQNLTTAPNNQGGGWGGTTPGGGWGTNPGGGWGWGGAPNTAPWANPAPGTNPGPGTAPNNNPNTTPGTNPGVPMPQQGPPSGAPQSPLFYFSDPRSGVQMINEQILKGEGAKDPVIKKQLMKDPTSLLFESR